VELNWFPIICVFLVGLTLGSFLNVCIYRLPRGMSVVSPARSFCPNCNAQVAAYDNIPVLSWLILRGKCRNCKQPIKARYAVIELMTGLLFVACYLRFGADTTLTLKGAIFCFLILGLIFTDLETRLLPDVMTIPGVVIGLVFAAFVPMHGYLQFKYGFQSMYAAWWRRPEILSVADAALAAAIGAGALFLVAELYLRLRGSEGMGFGDVKLMAMMGAFLGLRMIIFIMFAASLAGALFGISVLIGIFKKRRRRYGIGNAGGKRAFRSAMLGMRFIEMPFGVFLGGMALVALFYGDTILRWYFGLYF
jgi:leader peptidase (prepilin peptidase)/N-methyltransferase